MSMCPKYIHVRESLTDSFFNIKINLTAYCGREVTYNTSNCTSMLDYIKREVKAKTSA